MTKKELIRLIQDRLGDDRQKYHPNVVNKWISMAFNTIFYQTFRKDLGNLDLYSKQFNNVEVLKDADTDKYYCEFPCPTVQLPDPAEGIRNIHHKKDRTLVFVPATISSATVFDGLDVNKVDGMIMYVITNERIEFEESNLIVDIPSVSMRVVRPFEAYEDEETIYIPSGADTQLIELMINFLQGQIPESKTLDDNQKTI